MINKLKRLMEATSGRVVQQRDQAGIPKVDPATITLVTDETICSRAERAYTRALAGNSSVPSGRVYVVKVGSVYLVQDPQRRGGEFVAEVVMDASFRVLAKWLA